jgi:uncharacterized protein (TIGR00369 family)
MSLTQDQLQAVLETCEFDRWLGLSIQSLDESTLTVMLPFRTEIVGTPKIKHLHGGVVASLIDATGCYLLIGLLNKRVSTASLVVDYLRPAHGNLVAVARLVKMGSRICNVTVEVTGEDGKLAAIGCGPGRGRTACRVGRGARSRPRTWNAGIEAVHRNLIPLDRFAISAQASQ